MHTRRNTDMSTNMLWFSAYYSQCRWGHTVRIILKEDLPHNKGYAGDVISVRAGYARNCLIPTKKAVYAVPANFQKLNISDPDENTQKERQVEFGSTGGGQERKEDNDDKKAADLLKKYLSNKTVSAPSVNAVAVA